MVLEQDPLKAEMKHDELRSEYEFSGMKGGVRGKYLQRVREGTNLVLLDPDVARAFPSPDAVNRALRMLAEIAEQSSFGH